MPNNKKSTFSVLYMLPLLLTVSLVPLANRLRVVSLSGIERYLWKNQEASMDFFNKIKAEILISLAMIALVLLVYLFITKKVSLKWRWYYIPIIVLALFSTVSAFLQRYKTLMLDVYDGYIEDPTFILEDMNIAFRGFWDRYEGLYVLLGYLVLFALAYLIIRNTERVRVLLYVAIGTSGVIGLICILQYLGFDPFQTLVGKKLMLPSAYGHLAEELKFNFGKNYSYGTLYNPNYVGGYMSMLLPVCIISYLQAPKGKWEIYSLVASLLTYGGLVGSNSSTGIIAAVGAVLVLLIVLWKEVLVNGKKLLFLLAGMVVIFVGMSAVSGFRPIDELSGLTDNLTGENVVSVTQEEIVEFTQVDNGLIIEGSKTTLKMYFTEDGSLSFFDNEDKVLKMDQSSGVIQILDESYSHYSIEQIEDGSGITVKIGSKEVRCYFRADGIKILSNGGHLMVPGREVEAWGFEGREYMASHRGYLWSRSIPILKETIIVGIGPDAYGAVFPQYDLVGKTNHFGMSSRFPDKPHNMYLQIGINTGVLSLVAFIALIVMYLLKAGKVVFTRRASDLSYWIYGISASIIAYSISGIANDSVLSISSVFWILLGAGFALTEETINT